jgi:hypothetical protein
MNVRRLRLLADTLRRVDAEKRLFDMARWVTPPGEDGNGMLDAFRNLPSEVRELPCGFAACACGWYCVDHAREGLTLRRGSIGYPTPTLDPTADREVDSSTYVTSPFGAWEDIALHFGITLEQAGALFDPYNYSNDREIPAAHVLARVEALLAGECPGCVHPWGPRYHLRRSGPYCFICGKVVTR